MRLLYATRDGQSRRIAAHMAERLAQRQIRVSAEDLAATQPAAMELARDPLLVVIAAVRYGRHLPEAERFLAAFARLPAPPPLVLVSVNLTARKPGKNTAAGNPYIRKLIARHGLKPILATAVAGRLDYPRYRWLDRQVIRFIMKLTDGPTDLNTTVDYTSWSALDAFSAQIAELYGARAAAAAAAA